MDTIDQSGEVDRETWDALRRRIEEHVALRRSQVTCGGRTFPWYEVIDGEPLLERAARAASIEEQRRLDPFWAATWRAAEGLSRFLERLPLRGRRVLELGCGSGRVGLAAAALGAHVVLTDVVELALEVARLNTWQVRESVQILPLLWGEQVLSAEAPFPIIVASDVVYDPALFEPLEKCARAHLAPGGTLLVSEPYRHTGDHFAQWIVRRGWQLRTAAVTTAGKEDPIRVFQLTL
ncbi:MAG: SAM-dependent methyltransferase [Pirellulaceae bacterium]|nr:MAG: SAM-dependent methyltransferase [Pirellulaceae bacterium]